MAGSSWPTVLSSRSGASRGPTLRFAFGVARAERVDLLEEREGTVEPKGDEILLDVRPFEVLTLRVEPEAR